MSRSKSDQTMKFDQLIEYNLGNTFREKSCTKCGGNVSPRLFYKNSKWSISLDQQSEVLQSLILLYAQVEVDQNILKLRCCLLKQKRLRNSLPSSFSA